MDQIWAPWRMEYVKGKRDGIDSCVFCQIAEASADDAERHVIARSSHTFAVLNRYPYTYGHTMVIPYAHSSSLEDMAAPALADLTRMTKRVMGVLRDVADPPAFNIGANIGAAAGAGIAAHFHFHIVPRWAGDHNFMKCIGGASTLPGTLSQVSEQMREAWRRLYVSGEDA